MQAYVARSSMLQSRLLSTLDSLDVLQRTHQEELSSITTERDGMKMELQRYVETVKTAESKQNDMRDAVMKLIEKGVNRGFLDHEQIMLQLIIIFLIPNT